MQKLLETADAEFLTALKKLARRKSYSENQLIFSEGDRKNLVKIVHGKIILEEATRLRRFLS